MNRLLCAFFFLAASLQAEEPLVFSGAVSEIYKRASDTDLYLHRFAPPTSEASSPRPALVLFFGGGWVSGSAKQFEPHARYFSSRGMVVFLADYRTFKAQGTSPRDAAADATSAMRWVRAHASEWNVDTKRIAAGGGSAGGHLAAVTGICEGFDEPGEDSGISSKANALILFNPVYDNGEGGYGYAKVKEWFPAISPAHNHSADDPPTIVFLGTKDKLIPVATAQAFQTAQQALGIRSELHLYEGAEHGFFNLHFGKGKPDHFIDTTRKADIFLTSLGYLSGEPDLALLNTIAGTVQP